MSHEVRGAEGADFDAIRPLLEIMGHVSEVSLQKRFKEYVERADHCVIVGVKQGQPIGYAWAQNYGPHLRNGKSYARLHDLAVAKDHRCQGVGRGLFEGIIDWCRACGVIELQWQAARDAAPFYERLGLRGDTKSDLDEYPFYEIAIGPSN